MIYPANACNGVHIQICLTQSNIANIGQQVKYCKCNSHNDFPHIYPAAACNGPYSNIAQNLADVC